MSVANNTQTDDARQRAETLVGELRSLACEVDNGLFLLGHEPRIYGALKRAADELEELLDMKAAD
jgi:hypothetical protein